VSQQATSVAPPPEPTLSSGGAGGQPPAAPPPGESSALRRGARSFAYRSAFLVALFACWWLTARFWLPNILPYPGETVFATWDVLFQGVFYESLAITTYRVAAGFGLAFLLGLLVGSVMGLSKRFEAFAELGILTGVAAPGMFVAMITLVSFGLNNRAAILGIAIIALPSITVSFWQATKVLDRQLDEMGVVFGFGRLARVRHLILPQLVPPALAATRYGLGYAWKLVVVMELLGLQNGIGYQVNYYYQLFNLRSVLAWTIGFMLFVLATEYAVIRPIEAKCTRWRGNAGT
jgi:NitT/TauT family transport system permease protein